MRLSTRSTLFGFAFWVCLTAGSVLVWAFPVSPADAQTYIPHWDPETVQVSESDGEVVLTLKKKGPGHVRYQTENGSCSQHVASPTSTNCKPPAARAPDDYGAVSGDLIFTEAGSRTITIAIVDDDLDEGSEAFSVYAHEGDRASVGTGSIGTVWINDDDYRNESSGSSSSSGQSNPQPDGPQTGSPTRPAPPPAATSSSSEPMEAGNQSGVVNPGDPILEVDGRAGDGAEPIAADAVREDNFILMAGVRALLIVTIAAAAGFALKKRFGRKTT